MSSARSTWLAVCTLTLVAACGSSETSGDEMDAGPPRKKDTGVHADAEVPIDGGPLPDAQPPGDAGLPDAAPLPDQDGDGLPDAEDPEPSRRNDTLFSDTFEQTGSTWLFTSVSMRIDEPRSRLVVPQPEAFVREGWLGPREQWAGVVIRSLIQVTAIGRSIENGTGRVGLIGRVNQVSPDRYVFCGLDLKQNMVFVSEHSGGDPAGRVVASSPTPARMGEWLPMRFQIRGSSLRCTVGGVTADGTSTLYATGSAGFRSFDVAFEADWFEVYGL